MTIQELQRLRKDDIIRLARGRCKHGHNFLEHYRCAPSTNEERIGFLDIESSGLVADFGIMLSYCIKDGSSDKIYENVLTKGDIEHFQAGDEDRRVVSSLLADLDQFDRVVTYYGSRFDIPFIRTRSESMGLWFPSFGEIKHTDLYYTIKHKFRLSSSRLEQACRVILGHTDKTKIEYKFWRGGARGDEKSLNYILDHNRMDVIDLEKLYNRVIRFSRHRSVSA